MAGCVNSKDPNVSAIKNALIGQNLTSGSGFTPPDGAHFQLPRKVQSLTPAVTAACGGN